MRGFKIKINVLVEPDGDLFHAYCPALKGLHVAGTSVEGAAELACEAAGVYLNSLLEHGDPIPTGCDVEITQPSIMGAIRAKIMSPPPVTVIPSEVCVGA